MTWVVWWFSQWTGYTTDTPGKVFLYQLMWSSTYDSRAASNWNATVLLSVSSLLGHAIMCTVQPVQSDNLYKPSPHQCLQLCIALWFLTCDMRCFLNPEKQYLCVAFDVNCLDTFNVSGYVLLTRWVSGRISNVWLAALIRTEAVDKCDLRTFCSQSSQKIFIEMLTFPHFSTSHDLKWVKLCES